MLKTKETKEDIVFPFIRLLSLFAALMLAGHDAPAKADAAPPASLRVYVLDCGALGIDGSMNLDIFYGSKTYKFKNPKIVMSNPCFLVRHPKGDLMWDTGVPRAQPYPGRWGNAVPPKLDEELAKIGLTPEDVDYIALSHTHYDHTGQANLFAGATFLSDPAEYAAMFSEKTRAAPSPVGVYPTYSALEHAKRIDVTKDHDVFGDGSVVLLKTPGHSPGHLSLLLRLPKTGPVLLSGDLFHSTEARDNDIFMSRNPDAEATKRSMEKFNALAEKLHAKVVIQHEMKDYEALPHFPNYWE